MTLSAVGFGRAALLMPNARRGAPIASAASHEAETLRRKSRRFISKDQLELGLSDKCPEHIGHVVLREAKFVGTRITQQRRMVKLDQPFHCVRLLLVPSLRTAIDCRGEGLPICEG